MSDTQRIGDNIGRYTLEAEIGSGGMGRVFRAYDALLRRKVALKVLHAPPDDAEAVHRALREARMAAALDHPNVVSIHDVGEHEGVPYIVLEYVVGRSLRDLIDGNADVELRSRWLVEIGQALAATHAAGLVHRDVKPDNIMIRQDGAVKMLDFGIARRAAQPVGPGSPPREHSGAMPTYVTREGRVSGTPVYMAPEQLVRGEGDERSDQFAWGLVAFELFARRLPWSVPTSVGCMRQAIDERPLVLGDDFGAPPPFDAAVRRALAWESRERFDSMNDLLAVIAPGRQREIEAAHNELAPTISVSAPTELVRPPTTATVRATSKPNETLGPTRASSRLHVGLGVVAGVVCALAIVGLVARGLRGSTSGAGFATYQLTDSRALTLDDQCAEDPVFLPSGDALLFDVADGDAQHVFRLDLATGARTRLTEGPGWHLVGDVAPDGAAAILQRIESSNVLTQQLPLGDPTLAKTFEGGFWEPTYSRDGKSIWVGPPSEARAIDRVSGEEVRRVRAPEGLMLRWIRELPDGRLVAGVIDGVVRRGIVLYARGRDADPTWLVREVFQAVALAPDQRSLFVTVRPAGAAQHALLQVPLDGSKPFPVPSTGDVPVRGASFSRDGRRFVWSTCDTESDLVTLPSGATTLPPVGRTFRYQDENPRIIPGTSSVVLSSNRDGTRALWIVDTTGAQPARRLDLGPLVPSYPAVSGSRRLAFVAEDAIYEVALDDSARPRRILAVKEPSEVVWSPDEARVYFVTLHDDGPRIESVNVTDGARETVIEKGRAPCPSPAGDALFFLREEARAQATLYRLDRGAREPRVVARDLRLNAAPLVMDPEGRRLVVSSDTDLIEVEVTTGAIARHLVSGKNSFSGFAYVAGGEVLSRRIWRGDLWTADVRAR